MHDASFDKFCAMWRPVRWHRSVVGARAWSLIISPQAGRCSSVPHLSADRPHRVLSVARIHVHTETTRLQHFLQLLDVKRLTR